MYILNSLHGMSSEGGRTMRDTREKLAIGFFGSSELTLVSQNEIVSDT